MTGTDGPRDAGETRARVLGRALAVLFLVPTLGHLLGRGSECWPLVVAGLVVPWWIGTRGDVGRARRAGRVLAAAVGIGFATSVLPTLFGWFGFSYERVFHGSALAWLAWNGLLRPSASSSRWPARARVLLGAWAGWSTGSALHALWLNFPEEAPWILEAFRPALLEPLGFHSMVDPVYPVLRLSVRLETIALVWAALEVALRDPGLPRRLAQSFALALPAGVAVNLFAIVVGFRGDQHPLGTRIESILDRAFRPLPDHNALGSALVLMLLPVLWVTVRSRLEHKPARVWGGLVACTASGLFLLFGTTSKSAFLGSGVAIGVGLLLWVLYATGRLRRILVRGALVLVVLPIAVQALPREAMEGLLETRYVRDVVRAARFDFVTDYLRANRYALWRSAGGMLYEEPIAGVGLGRFPRRLPDFHDAESESHFNPLQENAHNQYLQWAAEEGLIGAGLGLAVFVLALVAGLRATRSPPPTVSHALSEEVGDARDRLAWCAYTASLAGLAFNLLVGHALFVPAVAGLFAAIVGLLVGGAARSVEAEHPGRAPAPSGAGLALAGLALVPLGVVPVLGEERPALEEHAIGCYPWLWQPGVRGAPPTSRLLGPDARWMERWGAGSRMVMYVKTIVAAHLVNDAQRLDVYVDGELVVEDFLLPFKKPHEQVNPVAVLKVDAPAGVEEGDLVEIRIVCDKPYAETIAGGHSQAAWGPRVWPATFIEPR